MVTSSAIEPSVPVFDCWRYAYPEQPPPSRVRWFKEAPSIFVGSWEELAFRRRSGLAWTDETSAYRQEFSGQALDRIAAMGCNHIVLPHTKGYGVKAVRQELDYLRNVIEQAHQRNLRVGLYLRLDNAIPEVLRGQYPEVDQWLTVGELGRPSHYSAQQTFRSRICHLHPGAMEYLESEIRFAVQEMGADLLHFDGMHFSFYPNETCRCQRCLAAYRRWLQQRYPDPAQRTEVFGVSDFQKISFPSFDPLQQATDPGFAPFGGLSDLIRSPDIQAWYRFRWDGELALVRHLRRFVRELNKEVAISINPAWGQCYNAYRIFTSWAERLFPWVDAVFSEDSLHLRYDQGRLVSRIGSYKLAREHDLPIYNYHWMRQPGRLEASLSLSAAANSGNLACMGFTIRHLPHFTIGEPVKHKLAQWVKEHWKLYQNATPAGEIGLLRHQPSLAWNSRSPWWAAMALEQLLVKMQIPWRMINGIEPDRLKGIGTLLLAEVVCLSDEEIRGLEQWVRGGGRILVTANTASHNQDFRRRPNNPLAAWVGPWRQALEAGDEAHRWFDWLEQPDGVDEQTAGISPVIANMGEGRVGFWPRIKSSCRLSSAYNELGPEQWRPPEEADELMEFVLQLHGEYALRLFGPADGVIEHHRLADGSDIIHLVRTADLAEPAEMVVEGSILNQRRIQVHGLDNPAPAYTLDGNRLVLHEAGRYTLVELMPR